jgi:hypothetical protein
MTNKHGYKMVGLKKAVSEMPGENYNGLYLQVSYDKSDGTILTDLHCSLGQNSWSEYYDKNIITIGNYQSATMQTIADDIAKKVEMQEAEKQNRAEEMAALEANEAEWQASHQF